MEQFVHNIETGETLVQDLSAEKIAKLEETEATRVEKMLAKQAQQSAKESAIAKLTALGLTEEEAQAIVGL